MSIRSAAAAAPAQSAVGQGTVRGKRNQSRRCSAEEPRSGYTGYTSEPAH